jgi:hypothetical protein
MKNLLKAAFLVLLALLNTNCANQVKVPNKINVETTGTTTIRHEIVISIEMKQDFLNFCAQELGPDATEAELASCQSAKIAKFTTDFLALISQQGQAK